MLVFLQGFDEYMNLVLDEAEEVSMKRKTRKALGMPGGFAAALLDAEKVQLGWVLTYMFNDFTGRILLKGDNITLMQTTCAPEPDARILLGGLLSCKTHADPSLI